ncbi:hypothetical protein PIB30_030381 [Stylosanthes scabra]|uniref:Uncharacterized protein n=1 Tax=Stylosanthes scabra TaxID=79078 RepID=A0ABU6XAQ0_9FABA|nr:hypothetical protein [Stylosanthes scabra]
MQRPDIRQKGEDASTSGRLDAQQGGDDVDFFSGPDLKLARFILHGEGSDSGSGPHPSAGGPSGHHRYGSPNEMYEVFSYGQTRLCSLSLTQPSSVRGFSTTSPRSSRTFSHHRSNSISCPRPIASRTTSLHRSGVISHFYWLSSITSPRSAITHRRPSQSFIRVCHSLHPPPGHSTTIRPTTPRQSHRPTRLSAHGHSSYRGIAIRPHAAHHRLAHGGDWD